MTSSRIVARAAAVALASLAAGCAGEDAAPPPPYGHTITSAPQVPGDFADEDELFVADGADYRIAWDEANLYLAIAGPSLTVGAQNQVVVYLGGDGGTRTGLAFGSQEPALAFAARWAVGIAPGGLPSVSAWNGSAWVAAGWVAGGWVSLVSGYAELVVPFSRIGDPSTVAMHLSVLHVQPGAERTFAACPQASFTSGLDPDYAKYFLFDRGAATKPNDYLPVP